MEEEEKTKRFEKNLRRGVRLLDDEVEDIFGCGADCWIFVE